MIVAYKVNDLDGTGVELETLANYLELSVKTIRRYALENGDFEVRNGKVKMVKCEK